MVCFPKQYSTVYALFLLIHDIHILSCHVPDVTMLLPKKLLDGVELILDVTKLEKCVQICRIVEELCCVGTGFAMTA